MSKLTPFHSSLFDYIKLNSTDIANSINQLVKLAHEANKTWWIDPITNQPLVRNKGEQMMLIVSEIAEAMEGARKGLRDDKLPHRSMEEVEFADVFIRLGDYAGGHGLDIGGAFVEKMLYNLNRPDHKPENRTQPGGKKW